METKSPAADLYKKTCKYAVCKKAFTARRLNMDYCSPDCKKKENNGKASKLRKLISKIDRQLKLNREILEHYYSQNKTEVEWSDLGPNGFDYTKHTELTANGKGAHNVPVYYNYSLEQLSNKNYKISKLW